MNFVNGQIELFSDVPEGFLRRQMFPDDFGLDASDGREAEPFVGAHPYR